ncbi:MAG: hypothetical protein GF370_04375 [Candidatus Nealsonbacteria bacterium]|nr:hypothetical protein [Candidatus Nealsonbacteria bacterium]
MDDLISDQEMEQFREIKGKVKGVALQENMDFILKEEGEGGLRKLEEEMEKLDCPVKKDTIKAMIFYPLWWDAVLLTLIERLFHYDGEKFEEMGKFEPKTSFIIRIFMKHFLSLERAAREVPKLWKQTYTVGDLEVAEYNQEDCSGVIRLKNYKLVPVQCHVLRGYFSSVLQLIVGKEVKCRETKCVFRGDECHEFSMSW